VRLEASPELVVLLRIEGGALERIRVFDGACPLDAGGLPVHWLTDVAPTDSLGLLARYLEPWDDRAGERVSGGALTAMALHADDGADALLERFSNEGHPMELRKRAAFWMGVARGRRGFESLRRLALDPRPELREHVTFVLTQSREPEAVDLIVRMAYDDASPRVRGQALFWLAQKAGQRAVAAISRAIEDDPETEVKTRAVFALSQLPRDQGVPLLIQQARANRNAEVRKQALFWLGQSGDPRALALFEQILNR
jgi:HEAT repeats